MSNSRIYTSEDIEATFEWLEQHDQQAEQIFAEMDQLQPSILAYLFADHHKVFSSNERELLVFASLVLYKCTAKDLLGSIDLETIEATEAANYAQVNDKLNYQDQIGIFFENYLQVDLLAFVEDFIGDGEDDLYAVSKESKLPIFVTLKTLIDVLAPAS